MNELPLLAYDILMALRVRGVSSVIVWLDDKNWSAVKDPQLPFNLKRCWLLKEIE